VQVSLDGDTEAVYQRQRPGASLAQAHAACRAVTDAGLPLEVTFAPSRLNMHESEAVIERARSLGAFRFNTGKLMQIGTAAKRWSTLEPTPEQYRRFAETLEQHARVESPMALCYIPFDMAEGLRRNLEDPPATMLVLPNGWVKVAAALPHVCADLRRSSLADAWRAYRAAWHDAAVISAAREAVDDSSRHASANRWQWLSVANM